MHLNIQRCLVFILFSYSSFCTFILTLDISHIPSILNSVLDIDMIYDVFRRTINNEYNNVFIVKIMIRINKQTILNFQQLIEKR